MASAPRALSHSKTTSSGMLPVHIGMSNRYQDQDEESYFSEKSEAVEDLEVSRAVSEEQNYSMDYTEDVGDDEETVKPKINLMSFAGFYL